MDYDFFLGFLLVFGFDIIENVLMNCFCLFVLFFFYGLLFYFQVLICYFLTEEIQTV